MRLYVNRDNDQLVTSFTTPEAITSDAGTNSIQRKRGDTPAIAIQFGRPYGDVEEIDASVAIGSFKFGAKLPGDYGGDYVISNWNGSTYAYAKTGTGTTATYTVSPGFNTDELNDALIDGDIDQTVADQAARYAYGAGDPVLGAIIKQSDNNTYWVVIDIATADVADGWDNAPQLDYLDLIAEIEVVQGTTITSTATFTLRVDNDVNRGVEGVTTSPSPAFGTMALQNAGAVAITGGTMAGVAITGGTIDGTTVTAAGRALLDDANAAAQRTTLGLGTMATQAASAVAISGGVISGLSDVGATTGTFGAIETTVAGVLGYIELDEAATPAAPTNIRARLFAEDNGSGKTRVMVRFATGAVQQIAIEP